MRAIALLEEVFDVKPMFPLQLRVTATELSGDKQATSGKFVQLTSPPWSGVQ
jgi:hypothetical protein